VGLQLTAVYTPTLAAILHVTPLVAGDWAIVVLLSIAPVAIGHLVRSRSTIAALPVRA
jgi:hypothetical protein